MLTLTGRNPSYFNQDELDADTGNHPVEQVNWTQAMEFCRSLTTAERTAGRLSANWEYRLPTEAQWEYACRAGTTTATAFGNSLGATQASFNGMYPYGEAGEGAAWERTVAVGSYRGNAWNLYDMHGNVWEWVQDCYKDSYRGAPIDGSTVVSPDCSLRILRGGSWNYFPQLLRSAYRYATAPEIRLDIAGFRVARSL